MSELSEKSRLTDRSPLVRLFRRLFTWRTLRRFVVAVACVVTLIGLFYAEENWRGKHAWEKFRREWEAKGERFDLASFIPKPVPPEQNFAMTPFLAPLLDYELTGHPGQVRWKDTNATARAGQLDIYRAHRSDRALTLGSVDRAELTDLQVWQAVYRSDTNFPSPAQPQDPAHDVLFALRKFDSVLQELHEANRRPAAVFPVHWQESVEVLLPYLATVKSISTLLRLRAEAYLEAGQSSDALRDVQLGFRLADTVESDPLLISHLVRLAIFQITLNSVWEGLARHRWKEPELVVLQKTISSVDLLAGYLHAMRGERAFSNDLMDKLRRGRFPAFENFAGDSEMAGLQQVTTWAPSGFVYHNQLHINRLHQEHTLRVIDAVQHRIFPERCREMDDPPELRRVTPYNIFARMLFPAFAKAGLKTAQRQTFLDLASIACALERFRLADGQYPETLAALTPRFLEKIPHDVVNGEPLKYRRTADGHFILYSVGWNQADDGGVVAMTKGKTPGPDVERGDWVWRYPGK